MKALKENLIAILLKNKVLSQEQLEKALKIQTERQIPLRRVLVEEKIIGEDQLLQFLSTNLYIPSLHLSKYKFDPEIVKLIPAHMAQQYTVIPISRIANTLTVAMADPLNVFALDDLRVITGCEIDIVLSPIDEISRAIETHYSTGSKDMQELISAGEEKQEGAKDDVEVVKDEDIDLSSVVSESEKPSIVKLVDVMLTEALKKRASDLHIEPAIDGLKVRYRVDAVR